jgi:hypothetical protein
VIKDLVEKISHGILLFSWLGEVQEKLELPPNG